MMCESEVATKPGKYGFSSTFTRFLFQELDNLHHHLIRAKQDSLSLSKGEVVFYRKISARVISL